MRRSTAPVKKGLLQHPVSSATPDPPANPYDPRCPTRLVLDRIGDKWSVLTIGLLRREPMRFNRLRREIAGVTQKTLSLTLKGLERDGLVTRTVKPTAPVAVEYALTPLGETLVDAIDQLQRWARDHIAEVMSAQARFDASNRGPVGSSGDAKRMDEPESRGRR